MFGGIGGIDDQQHPQPLQGQYYITSSAGHAVVFPDAAMGGIDEATPPGRIRLEAFTNDSLKTTKNFRQFCTSEYLMPNGKQQRTSSKGSIIHFLERVFDSVWPWQYEPYNL